MSPFRTSSASFFAAFLARSGLQAEKLSSSRPSFTSCATYQESGAT
jgi:hypothetical protein